MNGLKPCQMKTMANYHKTGWYATVSPDCEENTIPFPIRAVSALYTDGKNGRRREQLRHTNTLMNRIKGKIKDVLAALILFT